MLIVHRHEIKNASVFISTHTHTHTHTCARAICLEVLSHGSDLIFNVHNEMIKNTFGKYVNTRFRSSHEERKVNTVHTWAVWSVSLSVDPSVLLCGLRGN
jgi:hypothetical protein